MDLAIRDLLRRAEKDGIELSGIEPTLVPGSGVGIRATRDLEEGDVLMTIPDQAITSLHNIPDDIFCRLHPDMSIHGLLAAKLTLHPGAAPEWAQTVPKWADFEASVPYLWPSELQDLLPAEAEGILAKQRSLFERDWAMFKPDFKEVGQKDYLYSWLLVNTRTFYYETPETLLYPWHDRLALLPLADLFNHADVGCSVCFSTEGYTFTANRVYRKGDEVFTSYGEHSNDYLLTEYGFILDHNRWDHLCLDHVLLPKLSEEQKSALKRNGCEERYMLHAGSQPTDQIWIALRLLACSKDPPQWQSYKEGKEDEEGSLAKAAELLPDLLQDYLVIIQRSISRVRKARAGSEQQRDTLERRWMQIDRLVRQALTTTTTTTTAAAANGWFA